MKRAFWIVSWLTLVGLSYLEGTQPVWAQLIACPYNDCKTVNCWRAMESANILVAKLAGSSTPPPTTNPPDSSHALSIAIFARGGNEKFPIAKNGQFDRWIWFASNGNCPITGMGAQYPQEETYDASPAAFAKSNFDQTVDRYLCTQIGP